VSAPAWPSSATGSSTLASSAAKRHGQPSQGLVLVKAAGKLAVRIPKGESPATMPFEPLTPTTLLLQADTLVTP